MKMNKITFLLGSGASIPAGMPSTSEITASILGDIDGSPEHNPICFQDDSIANLTRIIRYLKHEIELHYQRMNISKAVNYEDIYHLANQIMFSELNQYSNPLSKSFLERHWNTLYSMNLAGNISEYAMSEIDPVQRLFSKITETIQDDVVQLLGPTKYKLDTLEIWNEVANDPDISCLHIYSLNHDLLLEKLFHKNETIYNDGFEIKSIVRCPVWNRNLFKSDDYKVHLYKLHGSIGWTFTRINGNEAFCRYPIDESSCSLDCPLIK